MNIDTRVAGSLSEYIAHIEAISKGKDTDKNGRDIDTIPVLWFRGLDDSNHSLIPSLFRTGTYIENSVKTNYSSLHYAEDIRTQHYIAKNYHFFQNEPSSRIEWLEVMQHHGVYTRVLDWSESSMHSLLFAVEAFLDNRRFDEHRRDVCVPCVWVLDAQKLNQKIFEYIHDNEMLIKTLLKELDVSEKELFDIYHKTEELFDFNNSSDTKHMDYILNLSAINDEILRDRSRIKNLLLKGDIINPYHYLISRIYSDGHILENRELAPFAVVNPYHSERIKAQKGVFTVFPFYRETQGNKELREMGINPDAMENSIMASECLHKIIIDDPPKVAYELMINGMNTSWLYPEMPIVSNEIESHKIYS